MVKVEHQGKVYEVEPPCQYSHVVCMHACRDGQCRLGPNHTGWGKYILPQIEDAEDAEVSAKTNIRRN
jgi:hypothetical protein